MKFSRLAAAAIMAAIALPNVCAKKKTPAPEAPTPMRVAWNLDLKNDDGTPADSTVLWVSCPDPGKANGTTVVMVPGGGYAFVSMQNEGFDWLDWFKEKGYTVGIINYRLPHGNPQKPIEDVRRAIGFFKAHSQELGIDPDRIGVMGFSAGGHLAATTAVTPLPDMQHPTLRPNTANNQPIMIGAPAFQVLFYPVISLTPQITHSESRNNFLGSDATPDMVLAYSPERHVQPTTPPAFIVVAQDDPIVKPENSLVYYQALTAAGVPVEMHAYPTGGHGFGFSKQFLAHDYMLANLDAWLQSLYQTPGQ